MELKNQLNAKQALELEIEFTRRSLLELERKIDDKDKFEQKVDDTRNAIQQKEDELEYVETVNQALVVQGWKTNDELQEARKTLINVSDLF